MRGGLLGADGRVGEHGQQGGAQGGEEQVLLLARQQALVRDVVREQARRGRGRRGGGTRTGREHLGRRGRGHAAGQHQVHVVSGALEHLD